MSLETPLLEHLLRWFQIGFWNKNEKLKRVSLMLFKIVSINQTNWGLSFMVPGIGIASAGLVMFFLLAPAPEAAGFQPEQVWDEFQRKTNRQNYILQSCSLTGRGVCRWKRRKESRREGREGNQSVWSFEDSRRGRILTLVKQTHCISQPIWKSQIKS